MEVAAGEAAAPFVADAAQCVVAAALCAAAAALFAVAAAPFVGVHVARSAAPCAAVAAARYVAVAAALLAAPCEAVAVAAAAVAGLAAPPANRFTDASHSHALMTLRHRNVRSHLVEKSLCAYRCEAALMCC